MTDGLQPFLSDAVVALHAPTQVWSARSGELGADPIHGVFHGDTRFIRETSLTYGTDAATHRPEWISTDEVSASALRFDGLLRRADDRTRRGLAAAAEAFEFRMPELHAGDARGDVTVPAPYPAECRPQAWSAAAAVVCAKILADA